MDPFEVRLHFLSLLRKLNASQQSIQKAASFAVKFFPPCGEDLWDCIVEECQKGSINSRINILYFLDSLCEICLLAKSSTVKSTRHDPTKQASSSSAAEGNPDSNSLYVAYVTRDLAKIVDYVVPEGREGLPNLVSTKQILESWRSKRVIDPQKVEEVLNNLTARSNLPPPSPSANGTAHHRSHLPKNEIFKRIEEDRERHKRLRERRWVQPVTHNPSNSSQLMSFLPLTDTQDGEEELTIDIEFENEWETTSDWNEDDEEDVAEEAELCFPAEGEGPMDLS